MRWCVAAACVLRLAAAEDIGEIAADRPGMTDPPGVLRKGVYQTELGTTVQWERDGAVLLTMGTPTFRIGVGREMELRFGGDGLAARRTDRAVVGHSDFSMGIKRRVWREGRLRPLFSVIPAVSMPVGNRNFTSYAFAPGVKLSMEKRVWGDVGVQGNLCWTAAKDDLGRYAESSQTVSVERDVWMGFGIFGEVYRRKAEQRVGAPQYIVDGGVTRGVNRHVVVDMSVGRLVEKGPRGWFVGFGIAFRHVR